MIVVINIYFCSFFIIECAKGMIAMWHGQPRSGDDRRRQWWLIWGRFPELWLFADRIARLDSQRLGYWVGDDERWVYRYLWVAACKAGLAVCPSEAWNAGTALLRRSYLRRRWARAYRHVVEWTEAQYRGKFG